VPEPEPEPVPEPEPEPEPAGVREPELAPVGAPVGSGAPVAAAVTSAPPAAGGGASRRVWVVDGRPRFHAQDCLIIKGQSAQSVVYEEAVADGFLPCSLCQRRSV
jgi:hypothetical protein